MNAADLLPTGVRWCTQGQHAYSGSECPRRCVKESERPVPLLDKERPAGLGARSRPWSNATPTTCAAGHRHASKMEARVCARLTVETQAEGMTLLRQVRLPLWTLAPKDNGTALYATVDFAVVTRGRLARLIDAKSPSRVSREWRRGAAALEAAYGIRVEEVEE